MSMNKTKYIPLETTATYQALTNLNVQFWNQDTNTAKLQFNITKNNYPLSLSEENIEIFIALESGDSFLVDKNFDFIDELNGVVSYTIPTDFMRVAKNVVGQIYVTTIDREETIVQRKFSFEVSNDLISTLPSVDKIREIRYFADMRQEVSDMMVKLNNDFDNMNDYVTQVQDITNESLSEINKLISDKEKSYNDNHFLKMKELEDKGVSYTETFDEYKKDIEQEIDVFNKNVADSDVLKNGDAKDWQKYKLTNDDGKRIYLDNLSQNIDTFPTGSYECVVPSGTENFNMPILSNKSSYFAEVDITEGNNSRKQIQVIANYDNDIYQKTIHSEGNDRGWKKIGTFTLENPGETVTGSQAKANVAENNAKTYTDEKYSKRNKVLFDGNANGVGSAINLSETLDNFIVLYIFGTFPGGTFTELGSPMGTSRITLTPTNVMDADGNGGAIYEVGLNKTTRTKLTISNDVYFDLGNQLGSGANANKCTIQKIVGVYA